LFYLNPFKLSFSNFKPNKLKPLFKKLENKENKDSWGQAVSLPLENIIQE